MNRKRIRFQQIWLYFLFLAGFFLLTWFYEIRYGVPAYRDNLNFYCKSNNSYLYDNDKTEDHLIFPLTIHQSCRLWDVTDSKSRRDTIETYEIKELDPNYENWLNDNAIKCKDMSQKVYCEDEADKDNEYSYFTDKADYVKYDRWKNCWFMVTFVTVGCLLLYTISWFLHKVKACGTKSFKDDMDRELNLYNKQDIKDNSRDDD